MWNMYFMMRAGLLRSCVIVAAIGWLGAGCQSKSSTESKPVSAPPTVPADLNDPAVCAGCHGAIVAEFATSMHAAAHETADPVFAAMRTFRIEREGAKLSATCERCHSPRAADGGKAATNGVTCTTCHNMADVVMAEGKRGNEVLMPGPAGVLRGPHDVAAGVATIHGVGPALPAIVDGTTVCLACHEVEKNAAGVVTCATGMEHDRNGPSCASCHMPEVAAANGAASTRPTHRSHAFVGPHAAWANQVPGAGAPGLLAAATTLRGELVGDTLKVSLHNGTGHNFPSGFPGRLAVLGMQGFDAQGNAIWQNIKTDPMKEHPDAVFNKMYVDAAGQPVLAPYGVTLTRDNTLKRDETRQIEIALPAAVVRVELALKYWLVAPPAAKTLQITGVLAEPRVRLKATVTR
jgi:hypothetical protein